LSCIDQTANCFIGIMQSYKIANNKEERVMKIFKMFFMALFLAGFVAGCANNDEGAGAGAPADKTAPTVSSTNPIHTAIGVPINMNVTAIFSEPVASASCTSTTFTLMHLTTPVLGAVTCVDKNAIFRLAPASSLTASTQYTATITTGVKDLAGNALAVNKTWSFTTGTTADTTPPTVSATDPADMATNVVVNRNITATFSEAIDSTTITKTTFSLKHGTTAVSAIVTSTGSVLTLDPTSNLAANTLYTATITTGVKDLAGNAMLANKMWSFTTGTATAAGPAPVILGTAGQFAILTKAGTTDVPTSVITGNVGASPITGAAIGLTCPEVTGTIYEVDAAGPLCFVTDATLLTTAVSDMELAYSSAAGRTVPAAITELGAGDISGRTLPPGLYKWGTGVLIDNRGITLNGGPNDVWIFQIAKDLTVNNGAIVTLSGGAKAKNIFWQTFGVAIIGTTVHFEGIILSQTAINLGTGASVNGRLLAQTAVTLDHNTVTQPAP
jgi:hypothetical protein